MRSDVTVIEKGERFTWKKDDFSVIWDCDKQEYRVYKGEKLIRTVFGFRDARPYLA